MGTRALLYAHTRLFHDYRLDRARSFTAEAAGDLGSSNGVDHFHTFDNGAEDGVVGW